MNLNRSFTTLHSVDAPTQRGADAPAPRDGNRHECPIPPLPCSSGCGDLTCTERMSGVILAGWTHGDDLLSGTRDATFADYSAMVVNSSAVFLGVISMLTMFCC
ncbi:hypothetical protein BU25DRAFT_414409 [Macroventuria anomochaeta]|uniref:Uncharacterized protein n=1 Tax=Macroventuria anomochaeta TaxID=301207 RepID=A0ACB6RNW3_9PLEO|nr:uncharacterized protein BU25DRAFT_414409 [Macroventuria anomochaeta]KAF2623402.1 hypothetical protein BU25DRAFT_414409 [Macroventuria anomochaeta]